MTFSVVCFAVAMACFGVYAQHQKLRAESAERWVDELIKILKDDESTEDQLVEHVKTLDS